MQEAIANLLMRILLVLTSCVGLALFAGAAQQDDQDSNKGKKKGGNGQQQQQQQVVAPQTGKKFKAGPGGGNAQNFQQPGTVGFHHQGKLHSTDAHPDTSERTNLNSSKSNKLESIHKDGT